MPRGSSRLLSRACGALYQPLTSHCLRRTLPACRGFHSRQGRPFPDSEFPHMFFPLPESCSLPASLPGKHLFGPSRLRGRVSPSVWPFLTFSGKGPTLFWEQEPPAWCKHLGLQQFTGELAPGSRHLAGQYQARALQNSVAPPRKTVFQMGHRLSVSPSLGNMVNLGTRNRPRHGNCGID